MMQKEEILKLSEINPELKAWLDANGEPPKIPHDLEVARPALAMLEQTVLVPKPSFYQGVVVDNITIEARDGYRIPVRTYKPEKPAPDGCPLVVTIHGGGWILGSVIMEEERCLRFVQQCGVVCANIDYRLAPEYKFPHAVHDCWDVIRHLAANAPSILPANLSKGFIVEGASAGGNLTDVMGHLARDNGIAVTGLHEMIPAVCDFDNIPEKWQNMHLSWEQNAINPGLQADTMEWMRDTYDPDRTSTLFSPLLDPKNHVGMPPVFIQAHGLDPLRDQAVIYHEALKEAGARTKLKIYPGLPHGFTLSYKDFKISKQHEEDAVEGLRWLLRGGQD